MAPSLLERLALDYFRRRSARNKVQVQAEVHRLDQGELRAMRGVERGAILRSMAAGALSSTAAAGAEIWADHHLAIPEGGGFWDYAAYWGLVGGVTGVAAVLEIAFLYWDALRSVHRLAAIAGLPVDAVEPGGVALALARAALELPTPRPDVGINPHREASKFKLLFVALLYKGKVALTSFLLKLLIRRVMTRTLVRSFLPLVAVPVTALWNGVVTAFVLREARIRALGPSAAKEVVAQLQPHLAGLSSQGREAVLRAVASAVVRTQSFHPNHLELYQALEQVAGGAPIPEVDDPQRFLDVLKALTSAEQSLVLHVLVIAAALDGRISPRERRLVADAQSVCGVTELSLDAVRNAFVAGEGLPPLHATPNAAPRLAS